METWKTIDEYPGYEVSDYGRVRRAIAGKSTFKGRILKAGDRGKGYLRVALQDMGRLKTAFVHHLVATAFHGPRPDKHDAAHLDGNRANNRADNLAWVTHKENHRHKQIHGTIAKGETNGNSSLTNEDVLEIKSLLSRHIAPVEIAKMFSVTPFCIRCIKRGKTWRHVP